MLRKGCGFADRGNHGANVDTAATRPLVQQPSETVDIRRAARVVGVVDDEDGRLPEAVPRRFCASEQMVAPQLAPPR